MWPSIRSIIPSSEASRLEAAQHLGDRLQRGFTRLHWHKASRQKPIATISSCGSGGGLAAVDDVDDLGRRDSGSPRDPGHGSAAWSIGASARGDIGTGLDEGERPFDCRVDTVDRDRVGARDDLERTIGSGIDRAHLIFWIISGSGLTALSFRNVRISSGIAGPQSACPRPRPVPEP